MDTVKEFTQAQKDYQTLKEFEEILQDDQRLLKLLSYRSAKAKVESLEEHLKDKDSFGDYLKKKVDKNSFTSSIKEDKEDTKKVEEAAQRIVDKLNKVLGDYNLDDIFDGLDLEIYFH